MRRVIPFLLCVLVPILSSCASRGKLSGTFIAPRIDCAAFDVPSLPPPTPPSVGERDVRVWQLNVHGWATAYEALLGQRVDTAQCLATLKAAGVIR